MTTSLGLNRILPFLTTVAFIGTCLEASANWPGWRGADGRGIYTGPELPMEWDRENHVAWRSPLPEPGNSTPIVWNNRIFVTQPVSNGNQRTLMCFDRNSGELLWQSDVAVETEERTHQTNPHASSSPVTDGQRVYCWFGSAGVVAFDFEGNEVWRTDLGKHDHQFGYGGSPVHHNGRLFLNFGPGVREFLVALNTDHGEELWRHESATPGADDIYGTWSTPIVVKHEEQPVLISFLRDELAAFNPATGERIWWTDEAGIQAKSSPVVGEGVVVMAGDFESIELAVRLGGEGDISESHILWRRDPPRRRIASGIIHNGRFFGVQTSGVADCRDLISGEILWEERLRGESANNAVWGSPILSGDKLYVMNQSGDVFIWKAADEFELLKIHALDENSNSSVVPDNGQLILRTHDALWCIGE